MDAASGVRGGGLGVEDVVVLEVWIGVASRARSTGRGRLQASSLRLRSKMRSLQAKDLSLIYAHGLATYLPFALVCYFEVKFAV